jgi:hypothetical protein
VADPGDRDPPFEQPDPCRLEVVDDEIDVANGSGENVGVPTLLFPLSFAVWLRARSPRSSFAGGGKAVLTLGRFAP